jgi:hypothetical protein
MADCDQDTKAECALRMAALERSVRALQQSNRELVEAVREATAESKRRSAALDDLAAKLLVGVNGIKLLKETHEHLAIPEGTDHT